MDKSRATHVIRGFGLGQWLRTVPLWSLHSTRHALVRRLRLGDPKQAAEFHAGIMSLARERDHRPEWSQDGNEVEILLTTHAAGGITELDFLLATEIDRIADRLIRSGALPAGQD